MKNSNNNFRTIAVALVALFSVSFANATSTEGTVNFPVNVKYLGASNSAPIFEVSFTNQTVEKFEITITDRYNIIYTETIKGKGLVRKYQFVSNELAGATADDEITVEIKNTATNNVITYKLHPGSTNVNEQELVAGL